MTASELKMNINAARRLHYMPFTRKQNKYSDPAGLLAWVLAEHLPDDKLLTLINSGMKFQQVNNELSMVNYFIIIWYSPPTIAHSQPYSYGDSSGFSPDSLFTPTTSGTRSAANVVE